MCQNRKKESALGMGIRAGKKKNGPGKGRQRGSQGEIEGRHLTRGILGRLGGKERIFQPGTRSYTREKGEGTPGF